MCLCIDVVDIPTGGRIPGESAFPKLMLERNMRFGRDRELGEEKRRNKIRDYAQICLL